MQIEYSALFYKFRQQNKYSFRSMFFYVLCSLSLLQKYKEKYLESHSALGLSSDYTVLLSDIALSLSILSVFYFSPIFSLPLYQQISHF